MTITIIEKIYNKNPLFLREREKFYMTKFNTRLGGLNLNSFFSFHFSNFSVKILVGTENFLDLFNKVLILAVTWSGVVEYTNIYVIWILQTNKSWSFSLFILINNNRVAWINRKKNYLKQEMELFWPFCEMPTVQ